MNGVDPSNPRRLTLVWLALLALSAASAFAAQLSWVVIGLVFVLGLAFFKVRLVARDFMDLRARSRAAMRRALLCWCLVLAVGTLARTVVAAVAGG